MTTTPNAPSVNSSTVTTKRARYVARPMGPSRENGPHLGDLRAFVALCSELPDDLLVQIDKGHMDERGRRDVTFEAVQQIKHERPAEDLEQELSRQRDLVAELRRQVAGLERAVAAAGGGS